VATDVWEFDVGDGGTLCTCSGAGFGMQVYHPDNIVSRRKCCGMEEMNVPLWQTPV
jgi:hypothetical protein